jgi:hypothetical protein
MKTHRSPEMMQTPRPTPIGTLPRRGRSGFAAFRQRKKRLCTRRKQRCLQLPRCPCWRTICTRPESWSGGCRVLAAGALLYMYAALETFRLCITRCPTALRRVPARGAPGLNSGSCAEACLLPRSCRGDKMPPAAMQSSCRRHCRCCGGARGQPWLHCL